MTSELSFQEAQSSSVAEDVTLVWAEAANKVIGYEGGMPWHVPEDLRHFQEVTAGATVVMGRHTWESLPVSVRPLKGRKNVVVTRSERYREELSSAYPDVLVVVVDTLEEVLKVVSGDRVVVIGGAGLFQAGLEFATTVEVTRLDVSPPGDVFAPVFEGSGDWVQEPGVYPADWVVSVSGVPYRFERWVRTAS